MVGQSQQRYKSAQLILGILLIAFINSLMYYEPERKESPKEVKSKEFYQGTLHPLEYTEEDVYYLTQALYFEDALGPVECQLMIGHVIQTRVYSEKFPNTYKEVIWQHKQFSYTHDGKHERMPMEGTRRRLEGIAKLVLGGYSVDLTEGSLYYYNPDLANPDWKDDYQVVKKCGKHLFLKEKDTRSWG